MIATLVVVAAAVGGIAGFLRDLRDFVTTIVDVAGGSVVPVVLPLDTGWILCGFYDPDKHIYIDAEPPCQIKKSAYPDKSVLPRTGDRIRIAKERNVVIMNFATTGLTSQFVPPWRQEGGALKPADYTGIKLPRGAVVSVRDVQPGHSPGRPSAVWVRIGAK